MAGGLSGVSEAQRTTFLEIRIYSRMPSEPPPRVGATLGSVHRQHSFPRPGGPQPGLGAEAETDQLVLPVRMSTEDALVCLQERRGSLETLPREEPLRSSGSRRNRAERAFPVEQLYSLKCRI